MAPHTALTHRLLAAALAFGFVACDSGADADPNVPEMAEPEATPEPEAPQPEAPEPEATPEPESPEPEMPEPEMPEPEAPEPEVTPEPEMPEPQEWADPSQAFPEQPGVYEYADRSCLTTGRGGVVFCGAWTRNVEADRWEASGDVDILLSYGAVHALLNAELHTNADGTTVDGTAETTFPAGQYWDDEEEEEPVEITIQSPPQFEGGEGEVSGVEFQGGMGFENEAFSFLSNAGVVLDPAEGVVKSVGGVGIDLLEATTMEDAEVTFALFDPKPFTTHGPFYNGEEWVEYDLRSALGATGRLHMLPFPVIVEGDVNIDLNADADDDLFWQDGSVAISADGAFSLGYDRFGFDLNLDVADAAAVMDCGRDGVDVENLYVCGLDVVTHSAVDFGDTPLSFLPIGAEGTVYAHWAGIDDFVIRAEAQGEFLWTSVESGVVKLSNDGVSAALSVNNLPLPGQRMDITGSIQGDGAFSFTGTNDITIAGFTLTEAAISVTNDGATATGMVELPGFGSAMVTGELNTDNPRFEGQGDITLGGYRLANAHVTLDGSGVQVRGMIDMPGVARVEVEGRIDDNPIFRGRSEMRPAGFRIADGQVELSRDGARISGQVILPNVAEVGVAGMVQADGRFELTGRADINPVGVDIADADVRIDNDGARVTGQMRFASIRVEVSGEVQRNGAFRFGGSAGVNFDQEIVGHRVQLRGGVDFAVGHDILRAGLHAEATVTPPNLPVGPESVSARVAGTVDSDGGICLDLPMVGTRCLDIF